jgi:hypothetical protein
MVVLMMISAAGAATGLVLHTRLAAAMPNDSPATARVESRPAGTRSKFTLGRDTTYFSGPLDKDGYVEYETALNERLSRSIVPEKNANVWLWRAFGPKLDREAMSASYFR